jgi:hypothetical protein
VRVDYKTDRNKESSGRVHAKKSLVDSKRKKRKKRKDENVTQGVETKRYCGRSE